MILVGQYDSPFVRRVAVALNHYALPFERRVLSVFADFDDVLAINPLGKVPVLILAEGDHLYDSRAILEYLEDVAPPDRRLSPAGDSERREMFRVEAVGIGLAEKLYERGIEFARRSPGTHDPAWVERLERQIERALLWLEAKATKPWLVGDAMTRADLAVAVAVTHAVEKLPQLFDPARLPGLDAHRRSCEALPAFTAAAYSAAEASATGWRPEAG
ncbi:MAG: glutathione S-transferase family protein [Kiloniellales bacterium]|nr:glutathione S-transferase family protein [Kiloniellales bacterium]